MIEPEPGHEAAFNRWYSDDHFYAGGMCLPRIFAGRRWVATRELRALRCGSDKDMADHGCYLHLNLFSSHRLNEVYEALSSTLQDLGKRGRMYPTEIPRRHLYTTITPYHSVIYRDKTMDGPVDIHALDYPFAGVVLELVDARPDQIRDDLLYWLQTEFIPKMITGSDALMCLIFVHADLPEIIKSPRLPAKDPKGDKRVVFLWFVESDPRVYWQRDFAGQEIAILQAGLGELTFMGPFIPTIPGTDCYVDEIR
jgi:hypothetical protein